MGRLLAPFRALGPKGVANALGTVLTKHEKAAVLKALRPVDASSVLARDVLDAASAENPRASANTF